MQLKSNTIAAALVIAAVLEADANARFLRGQPTERCVDLVWRIDAVRDLQNDPIYGEEVGTVEEFLEELGGTFFSYMSGRNRSLPSRERRDLHAPVLPENNLDAGKLIEEKCRPFYGAPDDEYRDPNSEFQIAVSKVFDEIFLTLPLYNP